MIIGDLSVDKMNADEMTINQMTTTGNAMLPFGPFCSILQS
jgi:hypothetical protein